MIKRCVFCLLLSVILAVTMMPATAAAASGSEDMNADPFAFEEGKTLKALGEAAKSYPEWFDLRHVDTNGDGEADSSFVTPVKLQNPYGTCWGFAAISAVESSILSNPELNKDEDGNPIYSTSQDQVYTNDNLGSDGLPILDLSEKHLAYFTTSRIDDPENSQNGEGMYYNDISSKDAKNSAYRYGGGWIYFATGLFASGIGPNLENRTDPQTGESLYDIMAYRGKNGEINYRRAAIYDSADAPPTYSRVPSWYSNEDDWSIPDKYRFYQSFRLKESIVLPNPAGMDEKSAYKYVPEATDAIKQQLLEHHRAVSIAFTAESFLPGQDASGKKYMSDKWAHYVYENELANHAVTIVGWDDNYPKENFLEGHQPPENGAWLIKNSWGSEQNEFPNNGYRHFGLLEGMDKVPYDPEAKPTSGKATGYFWISYYDQSFLDPEAFDFDRPTGEDGYYVNQLDYVQGASLLANSMNESKMANVFTADETAELTAISVNTTTPGTKVHYEVVLLPDDYKTPEDGISVISGDTEAFDYGGYHKIVLDDADRVIVAKGQKYAVIATLTSESGNYITLASSTTAISLYTKAIVNPGESFLYDQGKWEDLSEPKVQKKAYPYLLEGCTTDNFPIKSYLDPVYYQNGSETEVFEGYLTVNNWQDGNPGVFSLQPGETKALTSEFRGIKKEMPAGWDPVMSWKLTDESVAKIEVDSADPGKVVLSTIKDGRTYLKIDAEGFGSRVLSVDIQKPKIIAIDIDENQFIYNGKAHKPAISDIYTDATVIDDNDMVEGRDYKVSYKNNVNAGTGTITVTGIGEYSGTETEKFKISKVANPLKISPKTAKVKYSKLKKKTQALAVTKVIKFTKKLKDKKTYTLVSAKKGSKSFKKYFKVNKTTGKVTIKKNKKMKKGTYKVMVKVKALGNSNYKASAVKSVTFKVKVK